MGGKWHKWTREDYEYLKNNIGVTNYETMAETIGVSKSSVERNLKILRKADFDIDFLMSIEYKSHLLKTDKAKRIRPYTRKEREVLRKMYLAKAHRVAGL